MAVQIINPVDTEFPMSPLTVETEAETEDEFAWISLLCCSYHNYVNAIEADWEEDSNV